MVDGATGVTGLFSSGAAQGVVLAVLGAAGILIVVRLLGTVLGFDSVWLLVWGTALAFGIGGAAALVVVVRGSGDLQTRIPFGPPMIVGAAAALVLV